MVGLVWNEGVVVPIDASVPGAPGATLPCRSAARPALIDHQRHEELRARASRLRAPFFIVSSGRAGSTLLSVLLNKHPDVFVPPESGFVARGFPVFHAHRAFSKEDIDLAVRLFRCSTQDRGWGLSDEELLGFLTNYRPRDFADLNRAFVLALMEKKKLFCSAWGIKRPVLIGSIPRILSVFPEARIIHIYRDGRDVYCSYREVHAGGYAWGPNGIISSALYWADGLRRVSSIKDDRVIEVSYEHLITCPQKVLRNVCKHIGVSYIAEMSVDDASGPRKAIVLDVHQKTIHKKLGSGIDHTNLRKYVTQMSPLQIFLFELLASDQLEVHGYPTCYNIVRSRAWTPLRALVFTAARLLNNRRYIDKDRQALTCAQRFR